MTPNEIAQRLAMDVERVCRELLPNGRHQGHEWVVGSTHGEEGQSCKIRLSGEKAGRWCDFATGESGDLIDLWCAKRGIGIAQAMKEAKAFLGLGDVGFSGHKAKSYKRPVRPKCSAVKSESPVRQYLTEERLIPVETLKAFKIAEDGREIILPYLRDGELAMCKTLSIDRGADGKKKTRLTSSDQEPCLFGWQAIPAKVRAVTITEGEIDAMSLHQFGIWALSVPFGGGKGAKQQWIETEYPHLERFDQIFLCFDQDDEGRAAVAEIVERLGRHRCRIVNLPHKDANECLRQGFGIKEFADCFMSAKTLDPEELRGAADYVDEVIREFYPPDDVPIGMRTPWEKIGIKILFRPSETSVWTGTNGHGKSQLLGHVLTHGLAWGEKACIASMEMPAKSTLYRLTRQITGLEIPSIPYIRAAHKWLEDKLWIFAVVGTAKADRIIDVFNYARRRYGITQFVVDSLAKCGIAEDDYNGQKAFVEKLVDFSHEHQVHVHLVVHARKGNDEFTAPGKMDVKGTGAITDMVDNVFTIWRNKKKEKQIEDSRADGIEVPEEVLSRPDAALICSKQRHTGWEGQISLWFHPQSCQYLPNKTYRPVQYVDFRISDGEVRE